MKKITNKQKKARQLNKLARRKTLDHLRKSAFTVHGPELHIDADGFLKVSVEPLSNFIAIPKEILVATVNRDTPTQKCEELRFCLAHQLRTGNVLVIPDYMKLSRL